jgi:alpha-tubulin suppressor-like RCC1 family protein
MERYRPPASAGELRREFRFITELGRGGTAVVYLARDLELERDVAIKLIRTQPGEDADALVRFAHEARTAARLDHPNIVKVHAVRRLKDGTLALVMQHVPGRTLKDAILVGGAFPVDAARRVLHDIGSALEHAHERGIVHRDVKPENIFLDEETGRAMLADFGIARVGEAASGLTVDGVALGTPAYMAPEQIDGTQSDARSDLYGLASVGWEMLSGVAPWEGENLYSVIYKQKHESLVPVHTVRRDVPRALSRAIERGLAKDPSQRFPDVRSMLAAVDGADRGGVVERLRDGLATLRPRRSPAGPAGVTGAAGMVGEIASRTIRFRRPADEPGPDANLAGEPGFPTPERLDAGTARLRSPFANRGVGYAILALGLLLITGLGGTLAALTRSGSNGAPTNHVDPVVETPRSDNPANRSWPTGGGWPGPAAAGEEVAVELADSAELAVDGETAEEPADSFAPSDSVAEPAEPPPATESRFRTTPVIAAGGLHTCAVRATGELDCWGGNGMGQAGGGGVRALEPRATSGAVRFREVAAGVSHSCGVAEDGRTYCWGGNDSGQLGDGSGAARAEPRAVAGARRFRSVSVGSGHTCGVTTAGETFCWGRNDQGQLGDGTAAARTTPRRVQGAFSAVASGWNHSCALGRQGQAFCWGANSEGQLGRAPGEPSSSTPVPVAGGRSYRQIAAGGAHSCAVTAEGSLFCWGSNAHGQLGAGDGAGSAGPVQVAGGPFALVTTGGAHSCGLARDGTALCWGRNVYGQLGDGSRTDRSTPVPVAGGARFTTLHASSSHTCGVTRAGERFCWGYNLEGQLGDGTRTHRSVPIRVPETRS